MESIKQRGASSETSSDGSEQVNHDRAAATKRSYECTYCKRGFTNAQALGGHMNIHRKDRAKAKQPSNDDHDRRKNSNSHHRIDHEFVASNNGNNYAVPSFSPLSGHHHLTSWYVKPVIDHDHDHGSVYFHPGPSIPSTLPFGYASYETTPNRTSSAMSNEELMGANLSLQIECDEHDGVSRMSRGLVDKDVLDLELRLGYR